jgi:hypothetical protein
LFLGNHNGISRLLSRGGRVCAEWYGRLVLLFSGDRNRFFLFVWDSRLVSPSEIFDGRIINGACKNVGLTKRGGLMNNDSFLNCK